MLRFKKLINVLVFSLFVLAGCMPVKPNGTASVTQQSAASTTTVPSTPNNPMATPTEAASSSPATPTGQPPQATTGWQQYTSANLGITIAYPSDWSETENKGEIAFTSPGGNTIYLDPIQTGDLSAQDFLNQSQLPNTRCSSGKNSYGVQYRSCFDTIALSTTAYLMVTPSQGSTQFFALSTFTRGGLDVFNAMLASFHAF
jgi:hypothetical protein